MSSYSPQYSPQYYATGALPIPPSKGSHYPYQSPASYYPSGSGESTYSVSPPEGDLDASVSSASGYGNSYSVTTSYAGSSQGEYDTAGSAGGIDLSEYMQERFAATFDPLALDKCTAKQAQT